MTVASGPNLTRIAVKLSAGNTDTRAGWRAKVAGITRKEVLQVDYILL